MGKWGAYTSNHTCKMRTYFWPVGLCVLALLALGLVACEDSVTYPGLDEPTGVGGGGDDGNPSLDVGAPGVDDAGGGGTTDAGTAGDVGGGGTTTDAGGGGTIDAGGGGGTTEPSTIAPGSACNCDSDCMGDSTHPGRCINGICMQLAPAECPTDGSTAECNAGSRCWGQVCYPDCDAFPCDGACDDDGSCVWTDSTTCDASCSEICENDSGGGGDDGCPPNSHLQDDACYCDDGYVVNDAGDACVPSDGGGGGDCPPNSHWEDDGCYCDEGFIVNDARDACVRECESNDDCSGGLVCVDNTCVTPPCTADSCPDGTFCSDSGSCVLDLGATPPGPVPACDDVATWECTGGEGHCGQVVAFEPDEGPGYWDYPINGETTSDEYRSYCRRDLMMLVKYAAAKVACLTGGWEFGNGEPIGLGDMSESNGDIPGTRERSPGHPEGTHVDGHDMDIAYYQLSTSDNRLRAICNHSSGGSDQYHCVEEPDNLDAWRTALFIAFFHDNPQLRVIGIDGQAALMVNSAMDQLCDGGWYDGPACTTRGRTLAYETTDTGRGWFRFHHHHLHVSLSSSRKAVTPFDDDRRLIPGEPWLESSKLDPRRRLYALPPLH